MRIPSFKKAMSVLALMTFLAGGVKSGAEETQIEKPFSLETTLRTETVIENPNTDLSISGEYVFDSGYKILGKLKIENNLPTKAVLATGNSNIYLGAKWQNLSLETSFLERASLFKIETGIRNIGNFLDFSSFFARTLIPNMKAGIRYELNGEDGIYYYDTPLDFYTIGFNSAIKPEFKGKNFTITPWLSGKILVNKLTQNEEWIDESPFALPFNHFNAGLGIDFTTKYFDFGLENYLEGNYYPFLSNITNKARMVLHDREKRNSLGYAFSINPQFNWFGWFRNLYLQSDIDLRLNLLSGIYIKGIGNINHTNFENSNLIAVLGYLDKSGNNLELFYNLQNKLFGITLSMKSLGNSKDRYSKDKFSEIVPSFFDIHSSIPNLVGNVSEIHRIYGEDVSDAVNYMKNVTGNYKSAMSEISRYASYFSYKKHEGTFTSEQEHDLGYGVCRDTNGILLPTVINGVLENQGYKSWGRGFTGPYVEHALTIIRKPNGRYDAMNYDNVYFLDAKTEREAIDKVYPGACIYDGGEYSETAQRVINALEESILDF